MIRKIAPRKYRLFSRKKNAASRPWRFTGGCLQKTIEFSRCFAMPSANTFSIKPIALLLERWLPQEGATIVDPFARNSTLANCSNDLDKNTTAKSHLPADVFVQSLRLTADAVLFDPPYSPRQISEVYRSVGLPCGSRDTQNAALYKRVKDGLDKVLKRRGIAICCGWNTVGFGKARGYELLEVLLVTHGAAHNDTLVTVERKA